MESPDRRTVLKLVALAAAPAVTASPAVRVDPALAVASARRYKGQTIVRGHVLVSGEWTESPAHGLCRRSPRVRSVADHRREVTRQRRYPRHAAHAPELGCGDPSTAVHRHPREQVPGWRDGGLAARCRPVGCRERPVGCSWHPPGGLEPERDSTLRGGHATRSEWRRTVHTTTRTSPGSNSRRSGPDVPPPRVDVHYGGLQPHQERHHRRDPTRPGPRGVPHGTTRGSTSRTSGSSMLARGETDPNLRGTNTTVPVPGRYGLHFHHCHNGSRGTVIQGVVVTNSGSRAFVPHASHGITLRDCVAYRVWQPCVLVGSRRHNFRRRLTPPWTRCTTRVLPSASRRGQRVNEEQPLSTGFPGSIWGQGRGNQARGCVAAGVFNGGAPQWSGSFWPSSANEEPNKWKVVDCTAHNNEQLGFFAWQNDPRRLNRHSPGPLVAWHNGPAASTTGHTSTTTATRDSSHWAMVEPKTRQWGQLVLHPGGGQDEFRDLALDAAGMSDAAISGPGSPNPTGRSEPSESRGQTCPVSCAGRSSTARAGHPGWLTLSPAQSTAPEDSSRRTSSSKPCRRLEQVRVQNSDLTAWQLLPDGTGVPIAPFA